MVGNDVEEDMVAGKLDRDIPCDELLDRQGSGITPTIRDLSGPSQVR